MRKTLTTSPFAEPKMPHASFGLPSSQWVIISATRSAEIRTPSFICASASDVCEVLRPEKQAWQGRREGAYQERTCPTENAARRSFFARRALPTLLVEALGRHARSGCGE